MRATPVSASLSLKDNSLRCHDNGDPDSPFNAASSAIDNQAAVPPTSNTGAKPPPGVRKLVVCP